MALCFPFEIIGISSFVLLLHLLTVSSSSVIVDAPFGKIRGEIVPVASDNQSYVAFRNIPYAKPPLGDLRFAKPEPHPKIDGVFDGTDRGYVYCSFPASLISVYGIEQGPEDCLILNVFAKSINPESKLKKVLVYIYGGGYSFGFTPTTRSLVIAHDIITVTFNFRQGILGFLSTGNEASPGNYGLWDQALVLQWVKDNIRAFGGDPDDITVSGVSSGASSASYLSFSPVTKGLFSKAWFQSATATSVYAEAIDVQRHAQMIAKRVECWEGDITGTLDLQQSKDLLRCLRRVDSDLLLPELYNFVQEPMFAPTVDGDFVPRKPIVLFQDESYLESVGFFERSYVVSSVNNEYGTRKMNDAFLIDQILQNNETTEQEKRETLAQRRDRFQNIYVRARFSADERPVSARRYESIVKFYNRRYVDEDAFPYLLTDLDFLVPYYDHLNAASKSKKCKSWFLHFDYFPNFMKGQYRGLVHGIDVVYSIDVELESLIKAPILPNSGIKGEFDNEDLQLKSLYSSVLAEFMKTGNPGSALKDILPNGWPEYDATTSYYLNFNLEPTIRSNLHRYKRDFWLKTVPNL